MTRTVSSLLIILHIITFVISISPSSAATIVSSTSYKLVFCSESTTCSSSCVSSVEEYNKCVKVLDTDKSILVKKDGNKINLEKYSYDSKHECRGWSPKESASYNDCLRHSHMSSLRIELIQEETPVTEVATMNLTMDNYVMEYFLGRVDNKPKISISDASNLCSSRGDGWTIAASPNRRVNEKLTSMITENTWIAASRQNLEEWLHRPKWYWLAEGYTGRFKGDVIADEQQCTNFCSFVTNPPPGGTTGFKCGGPPDCAMLATNGSWLVTHKQVKRQDPSCVFARAYLCERSRCNVSDCSTTGTESVTGWYPNCNCVCKPGCSGSKCENGSPEETTSTTTTTTTTSTLRTTCLDISCVNRGSYYEPTVGAYTAELSLSLLNSVGRVTITLPKSLFGSWTQEHVAHLQCGNVECNQERIVSMTRMPESGDVEMVIAKADGVITITESNITLRTTACCNNTDSKLVTIQLSFVQLRSKDDESLAARGNSEGAEEERRGLCNFLGCYNDIYYLLAFSPVALLIETDDGYSGIIYSDIVIIGIVTIIHCIVVVIYKLCASDTTFAAACSFMMFPNISLYFVFALLPGIAVSAGELTAVAKPLGILALIFIVFVVVFVFLFPFLYLSRGLVTAPRSMDNERATRMALMFPNTVIVPEKAARMYGALVGQYRFCQPVWPLLPTLSSVFILIGALATSQRGVALYVVFGVLHVVLILAVLVLRPHRCLVNDALFGGALVPVTVLSFVRAAQSGDSDSDGLSTFATVLLVLMLVITIIRLIAALLLPVTAHCMGEDNYFLLKPIWVWNSKCGESLTLTLPAPEATSDSSVKEQEPKDIFLPDANDKSINAVPAMETNNNLPMESSLSTIAAPMASNPLNASYNSQEKNVKKECEDMLSIE